MQTYQNGLLTLQKLKAGNRQTIVVQHPQQVNVEGGQAVVTGPVEKGVPADIQRRNSGGKRSA